MVDLPEPERPVNHKTAGWSDEQKAHLGQRDIGELLNRSELNLRPVYIISGSRTPFLKARSGPGPFTPADLAVQLNYQVRDRIKKPVETTPTTDPADERN